MRSPSLVGGTYDVQEQYYPTAGVWRVTERDLRVAARTERAGGTRGADGAHRAVSKHRTELVDRVRAIYAGRGRDPTELKWGDK